MIEYLGRNMFRGAELALQTAPVQEFEFNLKIRVECPEMLWGAAVERYISSTDASAEDIEDLFGPAKDPSIENCLMVLALPSGIAGCNMFDVYLNRNSRDKRSAI